MCLESKFIRVFFDFQKGGEACSQLFKCTSLYLSTSIGKKLRTKRCIKHLCIQVSPFMNNSCLGISIASYGDADMSTGGYSKKTKVRVLKLRE